MSDWSASAVNALTGSFVALTTISVGLRFVARRKTKAALLADDWIMLVALFAFWAAAGVVFRLVTIKAIGYSTGEFPKAYVKKISEEQAKLKIAVDWTTVPVLACTKASAILFYMRVFCAPKNGFFKLRNLLIAMLGVIAAWFVTFMILPGLQCPGHFDALWNGEYNKYCTISWKFLYGLSVSDFLLDVIVVALPIPSIFKLHVSMTKKFSILAIFLTSLVAVAASLARMVILIRVEVLGLTHFDSYNPEHTDTQVIFYYIMECGFAILAVNGPSLWPLFSTFTPEYLAKMARSVSSLVPSSRRSRHSDTDSRKDSSSWHTYEAKNSVETEEVYTGQSRLGAGSAWYDPHGMDMPQEPIKGVVRRDSVEVSSSRGQRSYDDVRDLV